MNWTDRVLDFFAKSHGKGPCDAQGGATKRVAKTTSLRGEKVTAASELFHLFKKKMFNFNYILVTDAEVQEDVKAYNLTDRYSELTTIGGSQQIHRIEINRGKINLNETSLDITPVIVKPLRSSVPPVILDAVWMKGFDAFTETNGKSIAQITVVHLHIQEVKVAFWKANFGSTRETSFIPENTFCFIPVDNILKN